MPSKDLSSSGPKRILALDGGGIRGAITLGFLKKIETILRKRHGNDKLVLSDYFDLIGGTSTGAIIAGALAIGRDVDYIINKYRSLGEKIFSETNFLIFKGLKGKYKSDNLKKGLEEVFENITLGSDKIKTGLCIVTKRMDTGSTWPLINFPTGKYFEYNKGILLRNAVRASTAAPVYFIPEEIDVGSGEKGKFVDGGVSMFNNPAMLLFLLATLKGFKLNWKTGEKDLLLVSVGTGIFKPTVNVRDVRDDILYMGSSIPSSFMYDATLHNQMLLQFFSTCPTRIVIDSEIDDMKDDLLTPQPLQTYLRYNVRLEENFLNDLGFAKKYNIQSLRKMDDAKNYSHLEEIGNLGAEKFISEKHFPKEFDLI
ncbi:MAG: patatin-like phospholipase family protein [Bacteroidota bacterium]|nr:patatin-like phospholipase family protein [Bacteroidota bacterium]